MRHVLLVAWWFFLLVTMGWQGHQSTSYVGPFPTLSACQAMRDPTASRVMLEQWIQSAYMEPCQQEVVS